MLGSRARHRTEIRSEHEEQGGNKSKDCRFVVDESLMLAKAHAKELGYEPILMDADFAADLEEFINSHRKPLNPPTWD